MFSSRYHLCKATVVQGLNVSPLTLTNVLHLPKPVQLDKILKGRGRNSFHPGVKEQFIFLGEGRRDIIKCYKAIEILIFQAVKKFKRALPCPLPLGIAPCPWLRAYIYHDISAQYTVYPYKTPPLLFGFLHASGSTDKHNTLPLSAENKYRYRHITPAVSLTDNQSGLPITFFLIPDIHTVQLVTSLIKVQAVHNSFFWGWNRQGSLLYFS